MRQPVHQFLYSPRFPWKQRSLRDLVIQGGINCESPWADVSAEVKAKVFAVAAKRHPILERYFNSWATEEIMKQFVKNRRNNKYKTQELEVPEKYGYLKANAAKRNPTAPRGRQNKLGRVEVARKRAAKKEASGAKSKSKRKGKAVAVDSDDEEEEDVQMEDRADDDESGGEED
ncbi:hypothetical protein B0H16DRAFT_577321 [Mycena metata]|uniref:Uncharacterized protein n=1 Tax=Mycena metata TaxID=1033252 RepID=A0AAD7NHU2_9AGAR|nr:hypothetical protein B0H16DRAFT_577321 [Mycena metata]